MDYYIEGKLDGITGIFRVDFSGLFDAFGLIALMSHDPDSLLGVEEHRRIHLIQI